MSRIACFLAVKKESIHDTICTRSTRPRQITNVDKGGERLFAASWTNGRDAQTVFEPMIREARRQHMLVSQHYGKVELTWVFSNMTTRLYVGALLLQRVTGWYHDMQVRPFGGS